MEDFLGHVSRFRRTTLPRYSVTSGGTAPLSRPTWIPSPKRPTCPTLGPLASAVAPRVGTFPVPGDSSYGTEQSYITTDLCHATGPLRAGGRGTSAGSHSLLRDVAGKRSCPDSCRHRWAHPGRDDRSHIRISHPTKSGLLREPSFGLGVLVGCS